MSPLTFSNTGVETRDDDITDNHCCYCYWLGGFQANSYGSVGEGFTEELGQTIFIEISNV